MQLTIRNVPEEVKRRLQEHARLHRKSLNQAAVDALAVQTGYVPAGKPKRDVSFFTATEEDLRILDETVAEMDRADVEAQLEADRAGHQPVPGRAGRRK